MTSLLPNVWNDWYYEVQDHLPATTVYKTGNPGSYGGGAIGWVLKASDAGYLAFTAAGYSPYPINTTEDLTILLCNIGYPSLSPQQVIGGSAVGVTNIQGMVTASYIKIYSDGSMRLNGGFSIDQNLAGNNLPQPGMISSYGNWNQVPAFANSRSLGMGIQFRSNIVTASAATDQIAWTSHGRQADDTVTFYSITGTIPAPISSGQCYYVLAVPDADHFTIAATRGGAVINLTTDGSGVFYCSSGATSIVGYIGTGSAREFARFDNGAQLFGESGTNAVPPTGGAKGPGTLNVPGGYYLNGASITGSPNIQTFTTPGANTWTKPAIGKLVIIEVIGAGGGGARSSAGNGSGGGGGSFFRIEIPLASLGATETVTIGTGGGVQNTDNTNGNNGGTTSFGAWISIFGGRGGTQGALGTAQGGGGSAYHYDVWTAGAGNVAGAVAGLNTGANPSNANTGPWGAASTGTAAANAVQTVLLTALKGGAGGGGHSAGTASGLASTSQGGGNGGAGNQAGAGGNGIAPGGGGGSGTASGGLGGNGKVVVTVI